MEAPAPLVQTSPPVYRTWWFWTGAAVLAAAATGTALALSGGSTAAPTRGTLSPGQQSP